ncbi:MAG: hypothetical protein RRY54_03775 [Angelakisella sp.]
MEAKKSKEELMRARIVRELTAIAFAKGKRDGIEIKTNYSIKAMELLCKLNGLLESERKEGVTGKLDELIEGLRGVEATDEEDSGDDDV